MAVATAVYTAAAPTTANLTTKATALDAEADIASATWRNGSRYSEIVVVTAALANNAACDTALANAVTAVGGLIARPGVPTTYA